MDRAQRGAASASRYGSIETSPRNTSVKRAPHTSSDVDGKASNLSNLSNLVSSQNILSARSVSETDLQLGEVKFSYGYGGTAKVDSEELSVEKGFLRMFPLPGFGE